MHTKGQVTTTAHAKDMVHLGRLACLGTVQTCLNDLGVSAEWGQSYIWWRKRLHWG